MKKKFFVTLSVVVFCFTLICSNAFAINDAEARYIACEACGQGRVIEAGTTYGNWYDTAAVRECTHGGYPYYKDKEQNRLCTTYYTCTHCGSTSYYTFTESRWICLMP